MAVGEAKLVETDGGLEPERVGWFAVNVAAARFQDYGINIHVLWPGQPNCMYHGEDSQEDFLVLHGECLLLVEGQERPLRAWDFVHFPPWTEHVVVGAGSGPCAILMVGTRTKQGVVYPDSEVASRHGAGVEEETRLPREAYASFPEWERARLEDLALPWQ